MAKQAHVSSQTKRRIDTFRASGVPVLFSGENIVRPLVVEKDKGSVVHTHRRSDKTDMSYIASIEEHPIDISFRLQANPKRITLWNNATGRRSTLKPDADGSFMMQLRSMETVFVTF